MSAHDNGGPAFPQSETLYEDGAKLVREAHGGMSLRDWFAGQALAGICSGHDDEGSWTWAPRDAAHAAYAVADAMLAERAKEGQS